MHTDRSQHADHDAAGLSETRRDSQVLSIMLNGPSLPWSVEDLARELQAPNDVRDAIHRLTQAGLAHGFGDFVFPTRAAHRADELQIGTL